jgi:hypothetical protein
MSNMHRRPRAHRISGRVRLSLPAMTVLVVTSFAATLVLVPDAAALRGSVVAAKSGNLVHNGGFEKGLTGWRSGVGPGQRLIASSHAHGGRAAALLKTSRVRTARVEDRVPTVASTVKGTSYVVKAWVRAAKPTSGVLRVREMRGASLIRRSRTEFHLTDKRWHAVSLSVVAKTKGAGLDVGVAAWQLAPGNSLRVDQVTMRKVGTTKVGTKKTCAISSRGVPGCGAFMGVAEGSNSPLDSREAQVGKFGLHRTYWGPTNVTSAVKMAKGDVANRRVPWLSFKLPYSWADMAAGRGDAWARDVATRLGALNGPVWVAFHHEPEGDGPIADWVAMQKHLSPILRAKRNIAFTVITTGWDTFFAGQPSYRLNALLPDPSIVDIVGIDAYNEYGVTKNGVKSTKMTEMKKYYAEIAPWAKKHHVAWAVAETGYTDAAAAHDAAWLARAFNDLVSYGGIGLVYFDSNLNPIADSTWPLKPAAKLNQFKQTLTGATRLP